VPNAIALVRRAFRASEEILFRMQLRCSLKILVEGKVLLVLDPAGKTVREWEIIAGRASAEGPKRREGDARTPRGDYYICTINESSDFTIFYGISYPGPRDGFEGLQHEVITPEEYSRILEAAGQKKRPPWNTSLGGEVGIHGGGIDRDGTRGCIAMRDEDVLALKEYVYIGMPVSIE